MPMNETKRDRLMVGIIVGLALLNLALLAWMYLAPQQQKRRTDRRLFLSQELNFSEEQRKQYRTLREEHFNAIRPMLEEIHESRKAFFQQINDTTLTDAQLLQQAEQLEIKLARVDVMTFRHFQEVRQLCTPDQREKLTEVLARFPARWFSGRAGQGGRGHRPGADSARTGQKQ
ncbi:hypothetical protein GCM10023189_13000 [Nibrella saemangeumensis]|uniref:Periplasmic heavy metal sensor n=1 Tax=Nibrella saemangeumensis TaxID=1084526 RepID=A0ABP8MJ87_9BACT